MSAHLYERAIFDTRDRFQLATGKTPHRMRCSPSFRRGLFLELDTTMCHWASAPLMLKAGEFVWAECIVTPDIYTPVPTVVAVA